MIEDREAKRSGLSLSRGFGGAAPIVMMILLLLASACDHGGDAPVDGAAPAMSAIIPPFNPSSLPSVMPSIVTPPIASGDAAIACGKKPLPDCPLQAWMKKNMNPPMEAKAWENIALSLESAAQLAPPPQAGYTNWVSIAKDGANAARAAELDAVKAACRGCHDQYKTKYRTEMRTRPIP